MTAARVTYRDADGATAERTFECTEIALDLGQAIIDSLEAETGREIDTDGTDFWWTDDSDEQHIVMHVTEITEE
jgi:hypothetical protein